MVVPNFPSRRFPSASHIAIVVLFIASCLWLWLYLDSLQQRRKAERLFTDLKSFPFASTNFAEVRDFAFRHGGSAIQRFPPSLPAPGIPVPDSQGRMQIPRIRTEPTCTIRECSFEVSIKPILLTAALRYPWGFRLLPAMTYAGLRPWTGYAKFEVLDGKLERSWVSVGGFTHDSYGEYEGLVPLEYRVVSEAHSPYYRKDYSVWRPHITGGPMEILQVQMVQKPGMPAARFFDVNLRCLTAISHGCGFPDLAPSAWSYYQRELTSDGGLRN